jgi:hypothetical protein
LDTAGRGAAPNPENPYESGALNQAVFRGIGRPTELRDLIMTYLRHLGTSGLGDHDDRDGGGENNPPNARTSLGLSPESLAVLRAIRDEIADWRHEAERV